MSLVNLCAISSGFFLPFTIDRNFWSLSGGNGPLCLKKVLGRSSMDCVSSIVTESVSVPVSEAGKIGVAGIEVSGSRESWESNGWEKKG